MGNTKLRIDETVDVGCYVNICSVLFFLREFCTVGCLNARSALYCMVKGSFLIGHLSYEQF